MLVTLSIPSDPDSGQPDNSRPCLSTHPHFGPALSLPGHRVRPIGASLHLVHSGDPLVINRQLYHINALLSLINRDRSYASCYIS